MNAIAKTSPARVPERAMPSLPPKVAKGLLAYQTQRYAPGPGQEAGYLAPEPDPLDAEGREQARNAWAALQPMLAPVSLDHFTAWLMPVNMIVANPADSREAFAEKAMFLHMALGDIPSGAFTLETARAGMQRWKFFPTAAEIAEAVRPAGDALKRDAAHLRKLAERMPEKRLPAGQFARTEAEIEYASRAAATIRAEAKAVEEEMRPRKLALQARPLSPQQLLATLEHQIANATRAEARELLEMRRDALLKQFGEAAHG